MRIKKRIIKYSTLLKLKLIKTKIYLKKESYSNLTIEDVGCRLRKGMQVIFKFHANRKKIFFVGNVPSAEETAVKKLLRNTRHVFVPEYLWSNECAFNNTILSPHILKCDLVYATLKPKNNNHLTVILNSSTGSINIENYKAKIPTIVLSNNLDILDVTSSYKIVGNLVIGNKRVKSYLFLILLQSFIRKFMKVLVWNKRHKSWGNKM